MSSITHATPRLNLPRSSRLRAGYQHLKVRSSGLSFHGSLIRMGVLPSQDSCTQGAVVASRRVGSAVIRNRVKRRLKEIFRKELPGLAPGLWIVVTAKPSAANASTEALYAEWLRLAKRLSIFTAP